MLTRFDFCCSSEGDVALEIMPSFDSEPVPYIAIKKNGMCICQIFLNQNEAENILEQLLTTMDICFGVIE